MVPHDVIRTLQQGLAHGTPRSELWARLEPHVRGVSPLRRLLRTFLKELSLFERLLRSRIGDEDAVPPLPRARVPRLPASGRGRCRGCGVPLEEHRDPVVRRRHLWVISLKALVRRHWDTHYPPGSPARRARMQAAWAARRKRKDSDALAAVSPRIRRILGTEVVLARAGRGRRPTGGNAA